MPTTSPTSRFYPQSIFLCLLILAASLTAQVKIWKQTSSADFSLGTVDRVVGTSVSGGELRLIHPLMHSGVDTLDSSFPRYVGYDDAGNYVSGWIASKLVYAQKFNAQGQPLSGVIPVSQTARAQNSQVGVALLNDGRFIVGWVESSDSVIAKAYPAPRYCQFFTASNEKAGQPVRVFKLDNGTNSPPIPIADQINQRFFIVGTEQITSSWYQSFGVIYSASGVKLHDSIKIVPSTEPTRDYAMVGACRNGKFSLAWTYSSDGMGPNDIMFAVADSNGVLLSEPVQTNDSQQQGDIASVAIDEAGNSCVTWAWNSGYYPGPPGIVFMQAFDTYGNKIGKTLQVSQLQSGSIFWHAVSYSNGVFKIRFTQGFSDGTPELHWSSCWKLLTVKTGSFTSGVFDAGGMQTRFQQISWDGLVSPSARLKFQVRSSTSSEQIGSLPWTGPSSALDYYTTCSGENLDPALSLKRYLQVKAFFESDTNGQSPVLNSVSVSYVSADSVAPEPVSKVSVRAEHRKIVLAWEKSLTPDVRTIRIYRALANKKFDPESFIALPAHAVAYVDTSVSYDSSYRYAITAVDSAFNESPAVQTDTVSPQTMKIIVAPSGMAPEDGTIVKPFLKIRNAIDLSDRGDTILVMPGDYTEDLTLKADIALLGSGASATKIISSNPLGALTTASHTIVKGFTFFVARGIIGGGDDATITENILIHQGTGPDAGIYTGPYDRCVVSKNIIMNFGVGIQATGFPNPPKIPVTVRNNILYGQCGAQNMDGSAVFFNNTFIVRGMGGKGLSQDWWHTVIMNNLFAGSPSPGEYQSGASLMDAKNIVFEYNDQWNFNVTQRDTLPSSNFTRDPLFVNAAKNNYHLASGSSCINAGNPSPEYNDRDGSRNDIGAYGGPDPIPEYLTLALATGVSLASGSGFPNDTVAVDIALTNAAGVKQADIEIVFDEYFAGFTGASVASLTSGFSLTSSGATGTGRRTLHLNGSSEIASGSGAVATIRFVIRPSAPGGTQSAIEIGDARFLDGENTPILVSSVASGVLVVKSSTQFPRRVYVDGTNAGVSDGSVLHPFPAVQQGILNAKSGDTVFVAAGMYRGPVSMKSGVYVKGSGAAVTTLYCADESQFTNLTVVHFDSVNNTGISGCTLLNTAAMGTIIEAVASSAELTMNKIDQSGQSMYTVLVHTDSHMKITDNYFVESKNGGVNLIDLISGDATVVRNVFSPSASREIIVLNPGTKATISNNRFYLAKDGTVALSGRNSKRSIVANNLFAGQPSIGTGIRLIDAESTLVLNNIFDVGQTGLDENSGYHEILNNVFIGCAVALNVAGPAVHRYNLFSNNALNSISGLLDETDIAGDPQFMDREKGNYTPMPLSRLRNAGDPSSQWIDVDGTRNDIGLYGGPYADPLMGRSENMRLRIGNASGVPGDTVSIPVIATGLLDLSGLQWVVDYDSERLRLLKITTTAATRSFSMLRKNVGQSSAAVEMSCSAPVVLDSAAIADISLIVLPHAEGRAVVKIQNVYVMSGAARPMSVMNTENGTIDLTPTTVKGIENSLPVSFALSQNYPNPFNPATTIEFSIPQRSHVTVEVFDLLGRKLATLANETMGPGRYNRVFNASANASGIFFYRIQAGDFIQTRKMILMK
jgi:hypothetical protein